MTKALPVLQLACLGLIVLALAPLSLDSLAQRGARRDRLARAEALAEIGRIAMQAKDPDLAAQAFSDAATLAPEEPRWGEAVLAAQVERILTDASRITVGNALSLQVALTRALAASAPTPDQELAFGRVLHFRGKLEEARARYQAALARDPKSARGHLFLGDLQFKRGEHTAAAETLTRALSLDGELALARFVLGQTRLAQDKPAEALPELEKAAEALPENPAVQAALGKAALALKRYDQARERFEQALRLDAAGQVRLYRDLGDAWSGLSKPERAEQAYAQGWARGRDLESLRRVGRIRFGQRSWQGAFDAFNEVLAVIPDDPEAHCLMGQAAENAGNGKLALVAYRRCLAIGGGDERYASLVAHAQSQEKKIAARLAAKLGEDGVTAPGGPAPAGAGRKPAVKAQ